MFLLLWIVFNGQITMEIFIFGLGISAAIYWFICKFMDYSPKTDMKILKKLFRGIQFVFVLIAEIIKANFQVMRYIFTVREEVEPRLIKFRTDLKSDGARVALANSITLTPGTITVALEGEQYQVHCLDKELAEGIEDSIFVELLHKMEENTK